MILSYRRSYEQRGGVIIEVWRLLDVINEHNGLRLKLKHSAQKQSVVKTDCNIVGIEACRLADNVSLAQRSLYIRKF